MMAEVVLAVAALVAGAGIVEVVVKTRRARRVDPVAAAMAARFLNERKPIEVAHNLTADYYAAVAARRAREDAVSTMAEVRTFHRARGAGFGDNFNDGSPH